MKQMAFISRHSPTTTQETLAMEQGFTLVHVGDMDAFNVKPEDVQTLGDFAAVAVVHPAAALRLAKQYQIGVFENANRAAVGEPPRFEAVALYMYNLTSST